MDLRLLGNIELVDRDERVDLGGPVPRAVIAVLALSANQVVPLERLADAVWNGEPPASAARTLQSYIARLRRQLAPAGLTIETRKPGYLLVVDPGAIDANRFASLSDQAGAALDGGDPVAARRLAGEALALWRGPALADVAYADFAQPEIARLDEARMVTTELHVEAGLLTGKAAETAAELERLVAEHPLRERFRGQLMRALHWTGRTADALRVYQRGRQLLGEELGVEPGSDLQALEGAIIRNETSVAAPVATPAVSVGNLPVPITTFVGRQPELADLLALIGEHRLVTVSGPGGAGKTRIAVEAASRASSSRAISGWAKSA